MTVHSLNRKNIFILSPFYTWYVKFFIYFYCRFNRCFGIGVVYVNFYARVCLSSFRVLKLSLTRVQISKYIHAKFRNSLFVKSVECNFGSIRIPLKTVVKSKFLFVNPVCSSIYYFVYRSICRYLSFDVCI